MRILIAAIAAAWFATPAVACNLPLDHLFLPECRQSYQQPQRPPAEVPVERPAPPVQLAPQQVAAPAQHYELPAHLRRQERAGLAIKGLSVGDIFIDRKNTYLYLITGTDSAIRYGIGVGKQGFGDLTVGEYYIKRKQERPWWHPPKEMQARDRSAAMYPNGMPPGPQNPLGARALYLYNVQDKVPDPKKSDLKANHDSLFRIHGTNAPRSIGRAESSGCFRMLNEDVIDLYNRVVVGEVGTGTRVVVR